MVSFMETPLILGFYGTSNTGKTTILEELISFLTNKGYQVATVKKTDKPIQLDTPGKDTYRHGQAGASPVVFSSEKETTFIFHHRLFEWQIIDQLMHYPNLDAIFIEGCTDDQITKIQMDDQSIPRKNTIFVYKNNREDIKKYLINELERRKNDEI
jgi:molybdopterin-guanine dinucleotide biosynthesis protein B